MTISLELAYNYYFSSLQNVFLNTDFKSTLLTGNVWEENKIIDLTLEKINYGKIVIKAAPVQGGLSGTIQMNDGYIYKIYTHFAQRTSYKFNPRDPPAA